MSLLPLRFLLAPVPIVMLLVVLFVRGGRCRRSGTPSRRSALRFPLARWSKAFQVIGRVGSPFR
jgi:hypothetical protein